VKEPIGLLIAAARRRMKRALQDRVAPHGLTPQQFWVLVNIDEAEGPSLARSRRACASTRPPPRAR